MYIDRIALPGVGINYILTNTHGRKLGVICHMDGRREIAVYDAIEPDSVERSVTLRAEEADQLSDLLSDVVTVDHLTLLESAVNGVDLAKIPVSSESPFVNATLASTNARSKTRASVVAVMRDGDVIASPESSFIFKFGDIIIAAGSLSSVEALGKLVAGEHH